MRGCVTHSSGWPLRALLGYGMGHSVLVFSKELVGLWSSNLGKIEGCGFPGIKGSPNLCHS